MLHPESRGRNREFAMPRETAAVCDGEERDTVEINFAEARLFTKRQISNQMSGFVRGEACDGTCKERSNALPF
jgi:hypothetical protein